MSLSIIQRKHKNKAWTQAVALVGGVTALSLLLMIPRTTLSTWLNNTDGKIPMEYCIAAANLTGIALERLSPETAPANKIIRDRQKASHGCSVEMLIKQISINQSYSNLSSNTKGPIIIGTDKVLIAGHTQLATAKANGLKKISVVVIDLEALRLNIEALDEMNDTLSLDEKSLVHRRLEALSNNRQNPEPDFASHTMAALKNKTSLLTPLPAFKKVDCLSFHTQGDAL